MGSESTHTAVVRRATSSDTSQTVEMSIPPIVDAGLQAKERRRLAALDGRSRAMGNAVGAELRKRITKLREGTPMALSLCADFISFVSDATDMDITPIALPIAFGLADTLSPGSSTDYLGLRHFHMLCPHCGKAIGADLVWNCGYCDHKNAAIDSALKGSFFDTCSKCRYAPEGFVCPFCYYLIAFSSTSRRDFAACCGNRYPPLPYLSPQQPAPSAGQLKALAAMVVQDEIERIEQEIELTNLKTKLVHAKARFAEAEASAGDTSNRDVEKFLASLSERHLRRKTMMQFQKAASEEIDAAKELNDEEKEVLKGELQADVQESLLQALDSQSKT